MSRKSFQLLFVSNSLDRQDFFLIKCTFQILGGVRVGGQGWGDNSIQFTNIGTVVDKSFKEARKNLGGGVEGWVTIF